MPGRPRVEQRAAQPYAAIRTLVKMDGFPEAVDSAFPELFTWLDEHGVAPAGPALIRYLVIDMEGELEVDLGVPIEAVQSGDGRVRVDTLPAGRYVTACHVGPFDGLVASHEALQQWAREQEVVWDSWTTERGEAWRCRVEHYVTDPATEPDPSRWEVELAYLMADG